MSGERSAKGLLIVLAFAVLLGSVLGLLAARLSSAGPEEVRAGRYQISAWASYSGGGIHHSGYYVLDTVSGKVVDSSHEIHTATSESPPR